jgi:hypothetical protein
VRALPILLTLLLCPACFVLRSGLGTPVADDGELAAIEPGRTTAWEAVALLGPPEEWRSPTMTDLSRAQDELSRRVYEEKEIFGRRRLTWVFEQRHADLFLLLPVITFYGWIEREHLVNRVVLLLDDEGIVEHVAVRRELEEDE